MTFIDAFKQVQRAVFETNTKKGFHSIDDDISELEAAPSVLQAIREARTAQRIALIHSELSEALEAVRKNNQSDAHIPEFTGLEAELADAVIRIMNLATFEGARLAEAILAKAAYNETRPYRHGGKKF